MSHMFVLARLGRDAEVRFTAQNEPVTSLSLAYNYGRKGDDGKRPTQWVDASLWGPRGEKLADYLVKGTLLSVALEDIHIEVFKRRDGTADSKLVGRVASLEFAGGSERQQAASSAPQPRPAPTQAPPKRTAAPAPSHGFDYIEDDIPF